jgi:Na+-transporting NADH:ubiquinone oxidoreductase subunit F
MLLTFLISVLSIAALAAALALLMVVCDAVIANYGECSITVNNEKPLRVQGGRPLLATLKEQDIFIPSACGGRGSCGLCKVTVTEGAGDVLPTELPWLSPGEIDGGTRLACQVKVKRDLRVEMPAEWLSVRAFQARVASLRDLTYDIKEIVLDLVEPQAIAFSAGQFVQLETPPYGRSDEPVYRAYSIASPPSQTGRIEMEIRLVPNGICTTYVFEHLAEGDTIGFNGPYGDFHLRDTDRDIVFVAGGSGMAPIKSILSDMREKGIARKATYFFGARAARDLFLVDAMHAMETDLPDFTFVPALSEPQPDDRWDGETGLVTEVLDRRIDRLDHHEAYLCGSPLMIDACVKTLKAKGLPEDRIYFDKFA